MEVAGRNDTSVRQLLEFFLKFSEETNKIITSYG